MQKPNLGTTNEPSAFLAQRRGGGEKGQFKAGFSSESKPFMNLVLSEFPESDKREIHVILDNYCIHKRNDEWLAQHPNVTFHFTPTSASWLNQAEIWFGILSRKASRNASFQSVEQLRAAIEAFIEVYQLNAKPFVWRKGEVKGSQLKNIIANFCN